MENGKQPAFAAVCDNANPYLQEGLTKREYFAGLAMQGLLSNDEHIKEEKSYPDITADLAIQYADALLKALEEQ